MTQRPPDPIQLQVLGGPEAVRRWGLALDALHAFAQASGCPLGRDVVAWFEAKTSELQSASKAEFQRRRREAAPP